jgi:hypothetical protein
VSSRHRDCGKELMGQLDETTVWWLDDRYETRSDSGHTGSDGTDQC